MHFTFIDLFAGIGGFRLALESLNGECIAFSEIEKQAIHTYRNNFHSLYETELGDITKVESLPDHDILTGGVPCQSWSIAGKNRGIKDSRGQLWNDVIRVVDNTQPKAFLFENVKGLIDPRHRDCLDSIVNSFTESGYNVDYRLLNSYDFGIPQNRSRVFIVGIRKDISDDAFKWPNPKPTYTRLYSVLNNVPKPNTSHFNPKIRSNGTRHNKLIPKDQANPFFLFTDIRNGPTSIHSWDIIPTSTRQKEICQVILQNRRKPQYGPYDGNPISLSDLKKLIPNLKASEIHDLCELNILRIHENEKFEFYNRRISSGINGVCRIYLPDSTFFSTLTATGSRDFVATQGVSTTDPNLYKDAFLQEVFHPGHYRRIDSEEAFKIQGFPDTFQPHKNTSQNLRLLGNSVSPPVVRAIGESIIDQISHSLTENHAALVTK